MVWACNFKKKTCFALYDTPVEAVGITVVEDELASPVF